MEVNEVLFWFDVIVAGMVAPAVLAWGVLAVLRNRMRERQKHAGRRSVRLMRRKGEDTFAMKRRRMPYVAKIKRDDPFRSADRREIEAMVKRIAAAGETFSIAGWREDAGFLLFHFPTWAKARATRPGSTAVGSLTGQCRSPSIGRNRRVQRAGATEHFFAIAASLGCHTTGLPPRLLLSNRVWGGNDGEAPK